MKNVLKWIASILFIIVGVVSIVDVPILSTLCIICGLFIMPPLTDYIEKSNGQLSKLIKWSVAIAGLIITFLISMQISSDKLSKELTIINKAEDLIKTNQIDSAKIILVDFLNTNNQPGKVKQLINEIDIYEDNFTVDSLFSTLSGDQLKSVKNNTYKSNLFKSKGLNELTQTYFTSSLPIRDNIVKVVEEKINKVRLLEKFNKEVKDRKSLKAARTKMINKQFHSTQGYHIPSYARIKTFANDPSSIEHVQTKYEDQGSRLYIQNTYRGKNKFGAMVIVTNEFYYSIDGEFLGVKE